MESCLGIRVNTEGIQITIAKFNDQRLVEFQSEFYKTPIIYSFEDDLSKILRWHRNSLITIISSENINFIALKRIERTYFSRRSPSDNDIKRMYIEGMILSLIGEKNMIGNCYFKTTINSILNIQNYEENYLNYLTNNNINIDQVSLNELEKDSLFCAITLAKKKSIFQEI